MFKDTPNGQTNYYVSKCCNVPVHFKDLSLLSKTNEEYICSKCGDNCDIIPASNLSK